MFVIFSDVLRRIIIEQIASMMVLPNKLPIKLSDIVEAAELKVPEPEVSYETYFTFSSLANVISSTVGLLTTSKFQ